MFLKLITLINVMLIWIWPTSIIAADDLDQILEKLKPRNYSKTEQAYLAEDILKLKDGYGPMAIPKAFIYEKLSYKPLPEKYQSKVYLWNILEEDKNLTQSICTYINDLANLEQAFSQITQSFGFTIPEKNIQMNRDAIKWNIHRYFVKIKQNSWAPKFFKSLSQEKRNIIALCVRSYLGNILEPQES